MSATVIALPTAAAAPVPVWKRCNQNWPQGVIVLANERRLRRRPNRHIRSPEMPAAFAAGSAEAEADREMRRLCESPAAREVLHALLAVLRAARTTGDDR